MTAIPQETVALSEAELNQFRTDGYLGPYELFTAEEMVEIQAGVDAVLKIAPNDHKTHEHNRHLDQPLIHDISTRPEILERMACLYGPDLLLWRTNFFIKEPGSKVIPWHQDLNYWPLEPPVIASAWIAISPAKRENGCLQILPGSHRKAIPHIPATDEMVFGEMCDPEYVDTDKRVYLEMEPGQFILFNERTMHHSETNRSDQHRIGLAVRVVVPMVKVLTWDAPQHGLVLIRGEDRLGFNRLVNPPIDSLIEN
jgi:ectoine hydroxylase-related dioxygenase (phytanoyl-CoA dioxygenase family)